MSEGIRVKRVYDPPARGDGRRFLVERLWPRGIKKSELEADAWLKEVAPSTDLRKWFGHRPEQWEEFRRRYRQELDAKPNEWVPILEAARHGPVTLLYSARDTEHNGALVLQGYLLERLAAEPHTPAAAQRRMSRPSGRLPTPGPFHLEATVRALQRRPSNRVDVLEEAGYRRVLATPAGLVLVDVQNRGSVDDPDVRYGVLAHDSAADADPRLAAETRASVKSALRKMLGLDVDPAPLQRTAEGDPALREAALALRGMRPPRFEGLFQTFANVVPFQQVSLDAGSAIVGRLVERFGEHVEHGGRRYHAFPPAGAIAEARVVTLRESGLSGRKAETLRELARVVESGALSEPELARMSTHDALATLTALPGIGPWSAALVLLRGLGRIDVFPPGDVGAAKGLRGLIGLSSDEPIDHAVERFGPYRGYVYFLVLGASLLAKGLVHPAPEDTRRAP